MKVVQSPCSANIEAVNATMPVTYTGVHFASTRGKFQHSKPYALVTKIQDMFYLVS
jgi:hypothetical protein